MYYLNSMVFADPPPKFCEVSSSIWFHQESFCTPLLDCTLFYCMPWACARRREEIPFFVVTVRVRHEYLPP